MVRGNDIHEHSMGVGACIRQKGTYDGLCSATMIGIVGLHEEIVVQGNDIHGLEVDICVGARAIWIVGLREEIEVQENDIHEHLVEVDICEGARAIGIVGRREEIEVRENDIHEHLTEVDICVGARVIWIVGLREGIEVQENDIHEHLTEVDVCVRQKGTCDDWCDIGEMTIDGHHEDSPFVKIDYPKPKSGTGDGVVGSGYSGGSRNLSHRSKVH